MAESQSTVSRRSFIVGCGAAAATAAVAAPVVQTAMPWGAERVAAAVTWREGAAAHLSAAREIYLAEIARFAESLRPRFEAGELRAYRSGDGEHGNPESPQYEIEALCAARFGLEVTTEEDAYGYEEHVGNGEAAYLILAASPHAEATEDAHHHPCYHAQEAAGWDVIACARERGWYTPSADECEDPALEAPCSDCGHRLSAHGDGKHDKAGCAVMDCDCAVRHAAHVPGPMLA